jgi:hypothetical protein
MSCFTSNSEVRSNDSSCFTSNSEVKSKEHTQHLDLRLTVRSEAMNHLALHLTVRSEARNIYTTHFRECPFRLYQYYLKSVQTLHEIEVWSTHQQPVHLCKHIGYLRLLSAPYHGCNDSESLCTSTYHEIQYSLSSLCISGCHIGSWLLPSLDQINWSTTFEAI